MFYVYTLKRTQTSTSELHSKFVCYVLTSECLCSVMTDLQRTLVLISEFLCCSVLHVLKRTPLSTVEHDIVYVCALKGTLLLFFYQGKRTVDAEGHESINDMYTENNMLQTENDRLRQRIKVLSDAIESLKADNAHLMAEAAAFSLMGQNGKAEPTAIRGTLFDQFTAL